MAYEFNVNKFYDKYEAKIANEKKSQKSYNKAQYTSKASSPNGFNYGSIAESVSKRNKEYLAEKEERDLLATQQKEIDSQYQTEVNKSSNRQGFMGGVDRVFDVLSTGGYVVNGLLQDGLGGAYEGLKGGLDGFTKEEHGKEYYFNDTLDKVTGGAWNKVQPETILGKTGKFAVNLAGEILTDPFTYLGGAGIAKSLVRGTGTRATGLIGRTAMKEITEDAIVQAGKKLVRATGDDLSKSVAESVVLNAPKYTNKANKLAGNIVTKGDLTLGIGKAKVTLKGSGDVIRKLGDATISPYYNTLQDAIKRANPFNAITTTGKLKKELVAGNYDNFVRYMNIKDTEIAGRHARLSTVNEILGRTNNDATVFKRGASKDNVKAQEEMFDVLDNIKHYDEVEELTYIGGKGNEMLDGFIEEMTLNSPDALKDVSVNTILDELRQSDNVFEALKTPQNQFQRFVYKKLIDPESAYKNYDEAYTAFLGKYKVKKTNVNPVSLAPVQNVGEVATKNTRRLDTMDMETGLFVNSQNTEKLSALLKQNQTISTIAALPVEKKISYLNDILFDGKQVIALTEHTEESINMALIAIKNGGDETRILSALQDTLDYSKSHSLDDLFMTTDELAHFEETLALPERYDTIHNRILTSGLSQEDGVIRLYNKETGELFYSLDKAKASVDDIADSVTKYTGETAVERVAQNNEQLEAIKGVVKGDKTIADTGLIETITKEKQMIVDDYINTMAKDLPDDIKEMIGDDERLDWFLASVIDEKGNVDLTSLANYVGRKMNVDYALKNGYTPKDLSKYDNAMYNSLDVMPQVKLSSNYTKSVRQMLGDIGRKKNGELVNQEIIDLISGGTLSDDAATVALLFRNGKFGGIEDMLLNSQLIENAGESPVIEFLTALRDKLPEINPATKDFRKKNVNTFIEYLDDLFYGSSKAKYGEAVEEYAKHADTLKTINEAKNGKFYSQDVVKNLMKAEMDLPSELRTVKDMYTDTIIDADGAVIQMTYDPYTMETAQKAISKTIVDNNMTPGLQVDSSMTQLDYFFNHAYKNDVLNQKFTEYVNSTFKVPKNSQYMIKQGVAYAKHMDLRLNLSQVDLSDEMKATLQFVFAELKHLGMAEHTAKKLDTMLNAYVPHILNKEMFKNPNLMKALKKDQPELYRMVFKSGGDKFNPSNIGRSGELEEAVKRILGSTYMKNGKEFETTGKTVYEVNEALKPLLKSAGFDGDFFVNNLYDAFAQRVVTHGDVLYSDKIIDQTLELFGKYVLPERVQKNGTYYLSQKDLSRFFSNISEDKQYIMFQELGIDMEKTYNKMLIGVKGDRMQKFYEIAKKWKQEVDTLPNFVAYELPEQVAHFVQNKGYTQMMDDTNVVLKVIDKFTNLWKQTATVINPGFHLRNKISNSFNTFLNCGADTFNPQTRKTVKEILEGKEGMLMLEGGGEVSFQAIRDQLVSRDIVSFQNFNRTDNVLGNSGTSLFGEELRGSGGVFEAMGRMLGKENPSMFNKIDPTDTANFIGFTAGRKFGGGIEDYDRALNFVSRVRQGETFDTAHELVNKFLFDYSDLTPFEMNVMKRIVPFYTWLRKNAPLQMEMVLEKPWVYSTVAHTQREANRGADQTHLPSYMQEWFRLPIQFEENDIYANLSLPYADLFTNPTDPSEMFGMVNPLIKAPIELGINKNTYYGTEIYNENDTVDEAKAKQRKYLKNSLLGGYNAWGDAIGAVASGNKKGLLEEVTPLVTGITPKVYDADKAKEDAIYRAIRNMEGKLASEEIKSTGLTKTFDEYKQTKLDKYGYSSK